MVGLDRRALLVAGVPAALLAACGGTGPTTSDQPTAPVLGRSETARKGDQELLAFLLGLEQAAVTEVAEELRAKLTDGTPIPPGRKPTEGELIAAYMDALPKLSDPELRGLAFDRLVEHAKHEAEDREDAVSEAFVYGQAPA